MKESDLIASILAGDKELFHNLIQPYERMIFSTVSAVLKNDVDAEDVAQEAVIKAYRNLASFRGDAKFSTWLTAIALNEARSRLSRAKRNDVASLDEEMELHGGDFTPAALTDWHEIPSEALANREVAFMIESAVRGLPSIYREVFTLRDVDQLNTQETAELLNVSIQVVKTRLHRARMLLQQRLAPALRPAPARRSWFFGRRR